VSVVHRWALLVLLLLGASACKTREAEPSRAVASASAKVGARRYVPPPVDSGLEPASAVAGCRAILVQGDVRRGGAALSQSSMVDGRTWLELGAGANVVLKHPGSGREFALLGPARARACVEGDEQLIVASGTLRTTAGTGARPGAEVLVATPAGIVRYGDAELEGRIDSKRVVVEVRAGEVWLEPLLGSRATGPAHLFGRGKSSLAAPKGASGETAAAACAEASKLAAELAVAVLDRAQAQTTLGERAAKQLRARQAARGTCRTALARLGAEPDSAQRQRLEKSIESSERLWQTVP
jgi:hypothetical protein